MGGFDQVGPVPNDHDDAAAPSRGPAAVRLKSCCFQNGAQSPSFAFEGQSTDWSSGEY